MARPSVTVLAIGLSRKTCLPAAAAARGRRQMHVVRRRVDDRLDLGIGQDRLVARGRPAAVFRREAFALVLRAGVAAADLELAGALDGVGQHVRPPAHADAGDAQRFGTHRLCPPATSTRSWCVRIGPLRLNTLRCCAAHRDRLDRRLGDAHVGLPVAAADTDAADALAVDQHRHAALHGGPALRPGGERKPDRMADVEVLAGRALCRGRPRR